MLFAQEVVGTPTTIIGAFICGFVALMGSHIWIMRKLFEKTIPDLATSFNKAVFDLTTTFNTTVSELADKFDARANRMEDIFERDMRIEREICAGREKTLIEYWHRVHQEDLEVIRALHDTMGKLEARLKDPR